MTTPSGPQPRQSLRGMPSYRPGRMPKPAQDRPTYKLSSNETAYPPPAAVTDAISAAAHGVNRYPDNACTRLVARLADRLEVPGGDIVVGTGSAAMLYHVLAAFCEAGDEVVYAWRSFEAYPIAAQVAGARSVQVPLGPGARHDLNAMAAAITDRTRVVLVCSPNNPTGPAVPTEELARFLDRVPDSVVVVIDEAYLQFVSDEAAVDGLVWYASRPNVVVLRTFSKAYGLANLRVGYALARQPVADAIRMCTLPFPVSTVAEDAALAALDSEKLLLERVEEIMVERDRVLAGLRSLNWPIPDSQANFVWLPLGDAADPFAIACEERGVVVRAFPGDGCRVSIGEPEANDIVLQVASSFPAPNAAP